MTRPYPGPIAAALSRLRGMGLAAALAAATATAVSAGDAPPPATAERQTGPQAWALMVGNTVVGTTPDGPYSEYFAPDGSLRLVDGDGKAGGRWSLRNDKLCTQADDDEEECRTLEVTGDAGAFVDAAGARYPFTLLLGNAKGL